MAFVEDVLADEVLAGAVGALLALALFRPAAKMVIKNAMMLYQGAAGVIVEASAATMPSVPEPYDMPPPVKPRGMAAAKKPRAGKRSRTRAKRRRSGAAGPSGG